MAVSKTKSVDLIKACYAVGQRHFGENYVNELEQKSEELEQECPDIKWHYIGSIQSNKVRIFLLIKHTFTSSFFLKDYFPESIEDTFLWWTKIQYRRNISVQGRIICTPNNSSFQPIILEIRSKLSGTLSTVEIYLVNSERR